MPKKLYETELFRLQDELVKMQEWVRAEQARIVVIFEGRDAAGKGGTIKRVTEYLNPRIARIVALPAPTEREQTEWYFQRYIEHLPVRRARSCCSTAAGTTARGVERVMGFCTNEEYHRFLHQCPIFERLLVEDGILLQEVLVLGERRRAGAPVPVAPATTRCDAGSCPRRTWSRVTRWVDYSRAKDEMFVHTDIPEAPWNVVEADDKRRARINMIAHLLTTVPYHDVQRIPLHAAAPAGVQGLHPGAEGDADVRARPRGGRDPRGEVTVTGMAQRQAWLDGRFARSNRWLRPVVGSGHDPGQPAPLHAVPTCFTATARYRGRPRLGLRAPAGRT